MSVSPRQLDLLNSPHKFFNQRAIMSRWLEGRGPGPIFSEEFRSYVFVAAEYEDPGHPSGTCEFSKVKSRRLLGVPLFLPVAGAPGPDGCGERWSKMIKDGGGY